jgi:hypothetical protein
MEVFLVRMPFVTEVSGLVVGDRMRQDEMCGAYSGVPGFGFSRARYYVNISGLYVLFYLPLLEEKI